jgi:hypothetical protein
MTRTVVRLSGGRRRRLREFGREAGAFQVRGSIVLRVRRTKIVVTPEAELVLWPRAPAVSEP